MNKLVTASSLAVLAASLALPATAAAADNGFYIGAGVGLASFDADLSGIEGGEGSGFGSFDGDDVGYKLFAGWNFALAEIFSLGVEAGYVSLGKIDDTSGDTTVEVDASGLDLFGTAGVQLGPVNVFGKVGLVAWDADVDSSGFDDFSGSDDGTDLAYGIGAGLQFGSLGIRAEYEIFDIEDTDDVSLLSASLLWVF